MDTRREQTVPLSDPLESVLARLDKAAQQTTEKKAAFCDWFNEQDPQPIRCKYHLIEQQPDFETSWLHASRRGEQKVIYVPCYQCNVEKLDRDQSDKLVERRGIPEVVKRASFAGYVPETPCENSALTMCRHWSNSPNGFLVLYGNIGAGKTHLFTSIIRQCGFGQYRTHDQMVRQMRAGYGSDTEHHFAKKKFESLCGCRLLLWDEFGLGGSGADVPEMIQSVLTYRYDNCLPTGIAFNGTLAQFKETVGDRLTSRIRQKFFCEPLIFDGRDRRAEQTTATTSCP